MNKTDILIKILIVLISLTLIISIVFLSYYIYASKTDDIIETVVEPILIDNMHEIEISEALPQKITILDQTVDSSVETLDLSNCTVDDIDSFKASLSLLHNLKYLDMSDCNLSNKELAQLREDFPDIKIVWKIYFSVWSLKTDAVAFSVLISNFKYTYLTSKTIEVFKYCTDLQALDLGHQKITDISVIGDYLPNLRVLILADNQITDISPLAKLKHLHYLELFINKVKDLSPLASCKELVDLNLCYDTGIRDFSPLLDNNFPLLERVWLNGCNISSKNLNLLRKKYPNANISILYKAREMIYISLALNNTNY